MQLELRTCKIENTEIPYLFTHSTNRNAKTLLFLHATGFNPWLWYPITRKYIPEYTVIAPFFCNHRQADMPNGGLSWLTLAKDIQLLCAELGVNRPLFIGHSMGAVILTLAHAVHAVPVEKMLLVEPIFLPEGVYEVEVAMENHSLASKAMKRKNSWKTETELRGYLSSKSLYKNWDQEILDIYVSHGMIRNSNGVFELLCSPEREAALFLGGNAYNPWPVLKKVSCPVTLVAGKDSENSAYIDLQRAAQSFTQSTYYEVEGAGHMVPMEKPEEITAILDFLLGLS